MDAAFCVEALEEALAHWGKPEIFNTNQGSQFTGAAFTDTLTAAGIRISMDGRGRWIDNVFIVTPGSLFFGADNGVRAHAVRMFISVIAPGEDIPPHIHPIGTETWVYVLRGRVLHRYGSYLHDAITNSAGDLLHIQAGFPTNPST